MMNMSELDVVVDDLDHAAHILGCGWEWTPFVTTEFGPWDTKLVRIMDLENGQCVAVEPVGKFLDLAANRA